MCCHPSIWRWLRRTILPTLFVLLVHPVGRVTAQPLTPLPIKPMFGVDTNEFFKGAWVKIKPGNKDSSYAWISTNMGQLWTVMDRLRMSVIRFQLDETPNMVTNLANGRTSVNHRLMTSVAFHDQDPVFDHASVGREVVHLINHKWMDPGRYEIAFEKADLEPGTYVIELRAGDARAMTKVVRVR